MNCSRFYQQKNMRVTNSMMMDRFMFNMNRNMNNVSKLYNDYTTGVKLHKPSDDPILVARSLRIKSDISQNVQFQKNVTDAHSVLEKTSTAVTELKAISQRMRELMVNAGNGTMAPEDKKKVQKEIEQLREQITKVANDDYLGGRIFSGYNTASDYLKSNGSFNKVTQKKIQGTNIYGKVDVQSGQNSITLKVPNLIDEKGNRYTGSESIKLDPGSYNSDNLDQLAKNLEKNLNGTSNIQITSNKTLGDSNFESGDEVAIRFDETLNQVSSDKVKTDLIAKYGSANVDVITTDDKVFKIQFKANTAIGTPISFAKDDLTFVDGTKNEALNFTIDDTKAKISISKNSVAGDGKFSAGDEIDFDFKKDLTAASKADIISAIETKYGAANVEIRPLDEKSFRVHFKNEVTSSGVTFAANQIEHTDGTKNTSAVDFSVDEDLEKTTGEIPIEYRNFKVTVDDGRLKISNKSIKDDSLFAIENVNFDLTRIGFSNKNLSVSDETISYQAGISSFIDVNITGYDLFGPSADTDGDGIPDQTFFQTIDKFMYNLENDKSKEISEQLKQFDENFNKILEVDSTVGTRTKGAENLRDRIEDMVLNFKKLLSATEDTDMGETSMKLMSAESIYKASLNVGARILQPSLLDFLR